MALACRHGHRGVIAEHAAAHHGQRFDLGRIDLARHDRGTGLVLRQDQFAKAGARAGSEQANIVADLEQIGGASSAPWAKTKAPCEASASNLLPALTNGSPVMPATVLANSLAKRRSALSPVPTAVPPCASG